MEYARYVLASGTESEKTAFAAEIKMTLQINHGELEFYQEKISQ